MIDVFLRRRLLLNQIEIAILLIVGCLSASGCASKDAPAPAAPTQLRRIAVAPDTRGFVFAGTQQRFVPWGFNYDRDFASRLIEDYWEIDWPSVDSDFGEMKSLGANVVRVHLQFAKFMDSATHANVRALAQLDRLLRLAERENFYLDLTGLACYRKSDVPPWYDAQDERQRWEAQAAFWDAVAWRCASSPAVFCYDLINEPMVPAAPLPKGQWLHPATLGGFSYVQYIALDPGKRPRPQIAREWTRKMASAIRKRDHSHLVTIGLLPNSVGDSIEASGFDPNTIAPELDFLSVHVYPQKDHIADSIATLSGFAVGKPIVVEEMFPMNCDATELGQFIEQSRAYASGWLGFYWGQTPQQLHNSNQPSDALMLSWLELFQKMRPQMVSNP